MTFDKDDAAPRDEEWYRLGIPSNLICDNGAPYCGGSASLAEISVQMGPQVDAEQYDLVLLQEGSGYPIERIWIAFVIHKSSRLLFGTHVWCTPPTEEELEHLLDDYAGA